MIGLSNLFGFQVLNFICVLHYSFWSFEAVTVFLVFRIIVMFIKIFILALFLRVWNYFFIVWIFYLLLIISILKGIWSLDTCFLFVFDIIIIHLVCYSSTYRWCKILVWRYLDLSWCILEIYFLLFLKVSFYCFRILKF